MLKVVIGKETVDYNPKNIPTCVDDFADVFFVATIKIQKGSHRDNAVGRTTSNRKCTVPLRAVTRSAGPAFDHGLKSQGVYVQTYHAQCQQ